MPGGPKHEVGCLFLKTSSIVCSQNSENARGYPDLSSASTQYGLNYTRDLIAWKDMVVDGGMEKPTTTTTTTTTMTPLKESCDRIGIVNFLQGKSYLITGATGFLAKGTALLS
ncbi:hypothetical protein L1049_014426 [Liquidambar formosana]|uniref:Fatty acyl-CoA reductase n=1 Tax=Liquidambar formosana TaxID=63359 RepID=A0AAP0RWH9_LIQFO